MDQFSLIDNTGLKMWLRNCLITNIFIIFGASAFGISAEDGAYTIENYVRWPYSSLQGPFVGIFVALSLPLDLPEYNVFFSYNFEANYNLPQNESTFTYPPLLEDTSDGRRSWDRRFIYDALEFKFKKYGHSGRLCLLRAICEASLHSFENTGILGDLLHIILTPSTSVNDRIHEDYDKAEIQGKKEKNCQPYNTKCTISFLDLISWIGHYV